MPDVFNRRTDVFGGAFSADSLRVTFPALFAGGESTSTTDGNFTAEIGLLIQNMNMAYQQQVTRLYEVGTPAMYYVAGRTAGNGTIGRVFGPKAVQTAFYQKYGDVCQAASNSLRFTATSGCGGNRAIGQVVNGVVGENLQSGVVSFTAYFVVLTQLGLQVNSEQVVVAENLSYMFSSLDYDSVGNSAGTGEYPNNNPAPGT